MNMKGKTAKKRKKSRRSGICVFLLAAGLGLGVFLFKKSNRSFTWPDWRWGQLARDLQSSPCKPEVMLCEGMTVVNWNNWRRGVAVRLSVSAKTDRQNSGQLTRLVDEHDAQIKDRIRLIVASARPEHIRDPQLHYVKSSIQQSVEQIISPDLIRKILVPEWRSTL